MTARTIGASVRVMKTPGPTNDGVTEDNGPEGMLVGARLKELATVLADYDGRVSGLWNSPSSVMGATREELRSALAELYAEGLIVGQDWPHRIVLAPEVCP